jgi:hypothetical protein
MPYFCDRCSLTGPSGPTTCSTCGGPLRVEHDPAADALLQSLCGAPPPTPEELERLADQGPRARKMAKKLAGWDADEPKEEQP